MLIDGTLFYYNILYIFNIVLKESKISLYFAMPDMERDLKQI